MQCTVRYLSPRYKCTAAGERAESCAGGGWWRCWVPSKNRWTGALPPSRLSPCPHCPQPRPPASVTPERNVPTRGPTVGVVLQGVPYYWAHFVFCHFLGFWSTYRGTSDLYSTALEICYIIATRILKIDSEIAEIIEVKVGTCNTKIIFFDSV